MDAFILMAIIPIRDPNRVVCFLRFFFIDWSLSIGPQLTTTWNYQGIKLIRSKLIWGRIYDWHLISTLRFFYKILNNTKLKHYRIEQIYDAGEQEIHIIGIQSHNRILRFHSIAFFCNRFDHSSTILYQRFIISATGKKYLQKCKILHK